MCTPDQKENVNPYILLTGAIIAEMTATSLLNVSAGFSRLAPTAGSLVAYGVSFYLLSLTLGDLPIGVVYGTWAAMGIVGIAVIGVIVFDEPIDLAGLAGMLLIVGGVVLVNVVSNMSAH
jgi:small multidrug resistance pump